MRIGLARHYSIPHDQLDLLDTAEFQAWCRWYDAVETAAPGIASDATWDACYSSALPRALSTAKVLYPGGVSATPHLREVPFAPVVTTGLKLPLIAWQALSRAAWFLEHRSQLETRSQTKRRVRAFLATIAAAHTGQSVLLVSHGFLMQMLASELKRAGFRGRLPIRPGFSRVYVFRAGEAADPLVWSRDAEAAI